MASAGTSLQPLLTSNYMPGGLMSPLGSGFPTSPGQGVRGVQGFPTMQGGMQGMQGGMQGLQGLPGMQGLQGLPTITSPGFPPNQFGYHTPPPQVVVALSKQRENLAGIKIRTTMVPSTDYHIFFSNRQELESKVEHAIAFLQLQPLLNPGGATTALPNSGGAAGAAVGLKPAEQPVTPVPNNSQEGQESSDEFKRKFVGTIDFRGLPDLMEKADKARAFFDAQGAGQTQAGQGINSQGQQVTAYNSVRPGNDEGCCIIA